MIMKKNYFLIICLLFFNETRINAQILPSDCTTSDSALGASYYRDAASLVMDRLYFTLKSPDTVNVTINQLYIDSILGALLAVHNAVGLQHGDTIKNLHVYCPKSVGPWFDLKVDTNKIWVKNWNDSIVLTGDTTMDSMLLKYNVHSV